MHFYTADTVAVPLERRVSLIQVVPYRRFNTLKYNGLFMLQHRTTADI